MWWVPRRGTAWISLGYEGFGLSDLATFELHLGLYIRIFMKGEIYPDTCYLLWGLQRRLPQMAK